MRRATIIFKCGDSEHRLLLSHRDVYLLDGHHFFKGGWEYRRSLGLDYVRGLSRPPTGVTLVTHKSYPLILRFQSLQRQLETQADLLSFSYSYEFTAEKGRRQGGQSGFTVRGLIGSIDVRPSGYCDVTLGEIAPNGRGRNVEIIDMRVRKQIETDDKGILKIHRRKEEVGWFSELPKLLDFLQHAPHDQVEVRHSE